MLPVEPIVCKVEPLTHFRRQRRCDLPRGRHQISWQSLALHFRAVRLSLVPLEPLVPRKSLYDEPTKAGIPMVRQKGKES